MNLFALSVELGMDTSEFERGISQAKTKTAASVTEMKSQYKSLAASLGGYQSAFNKAAAQYGTSSQSAQKYSAKIAEQRQKLDECRKSLEAVGVSVEDVCRKMERASDKTESLSVPFSGLSKTLTGAFTKSQLIATAITSLAGKFASFGEGAVKQGTDFNQAMEKYRVAYTNMLGSAEQAQAVLNQIKQDAAHTPLNVDSLVQANQLLISAGVDAGKARSTILALGDAVSATSGGNDALSRMAANLQQIKNVGKASAADIKQFAMAGIDIYGILADYTGKSTTEVQNMTISYDLLTAALQKASEEGGRYYNAMETQSQTMSGRIETLKDNWSQLLGTLTEGLTETEGKLVTAASGWVQRLQEAFETSGANGLMQAGGHIVDDIATGISDGIPSLATQAAGAVQNFALYLQDNTGQIVDTGGQLLTSLANGILSTAPIVANAAVQTVSSLAVELWNNADKIFTAGADLLGKLIEGFLSLTGNVIEAIGNITAAIVTKIFTTDWVQIGKDIVSSIGQGILNGVSAMSGPLDRLSYKLNHALGKNGYEENTFEAWAAANGKTSETRYQQGSPKDAAYWKRYGDRLARQYGLNETGLDTGSNGTDTTSGEDTTKATKTGSTTETVISSISSTATTTAQNALGTVTTSIQTLTEKVKDSAGKIKDRITETTTTTGKEMVNGVATTFKQVETKVNGTVTKVTKTYDDMSKTLLGTFTNVSETTFDGIITKVQQAVEKYADGSEHIKKTVTETGQRIGENGAETYEKIITYIDGVQDKVTETAQNIDKSIKATQKRIEENLSKAQQQFNSGIFKLGKNLYTDLKNQDWAALGLDIVNMMWGEVSQEQREVLSDWANKALEAINEAYSGGGLSEAFNAFKQIMSNGIKADADGVTTDVKGLSNVFQELGINVSNVGSKIMGVLGTMGTGMGTFVSNAGTGIAKLAGSMGSLGTLAQGAGGLIAKIGGLIISNPEVAAIIAIVAGVAALGAALFAKFGKGKSSGGQAVSHYESPFAGHDVYDSLTEFSTRAAMQHRYIEKTTGTDAQLGILQQIRDMLDEHLPDIGTGQLVMDGEKVADMLTPRLATNVDARIGVTVTRKARGV